MLDFLGGVYSENLGSFVEKIPALRDIVTVLNVGEYIYRHIQWIEDEFSYLDPNNEYLSSNEKEEMENRLVRFGRVLDVLRDDTATDKGMEIFETFPDGLLQHLNLDENKAEDCLVSSHDNGWVEKRTRPVWGWKRAKHLATAM
jgi:hypothetical protein